MKDPKKKQNKKIKKNEREREIGRASSRETFFCLEKEKEPI